MVKVNKNIVVEKTCFNFFLFIISFYQIKQNKPLELSFINTEGDGDQKPLPKIYNPSLKKYLFRVWII